jgi:hypothetical protein
MAGGTDDIREMPLSGYSGAHQNYNWTSPNYKVEKLLFKWNVSALSCVGGSLAMGQAPWDKWPSQHR